MVGFLDRDRSFLTMLIRVVSILLALAGTALFLILAYIGYQTWIQWLEKEGFGIKGILAGLELVFFFPGLTPLMAAFYFLLYLKRPIYNLIGIFAIAPLGFLHYIAAAFTSHSGVYKAVTISTAELFIVAVLLVAFHRYFVLVDR